MEQQQDFLNEMEDNKLPSMLNVLTILTFIGSGLGLILSLSMPKFASFMINFLNNQISNAGDKLKATDLDQINKSIEKFELMQKNMAMNVIIGLVFCSLCIFAAILMRKRKKDGFTIYVVSRVATLIISFFILRNVSFDSIYSILGTLLLPSIMIFLYFTQRKYLNQ